MKDYLNNFTRIDRHLYRLPRKNRVSDCSINHFRRYGITQSEALRESNLLCYLEFILSFKISHIQYFKGFRSNEICSQSSCRIKYRQLRVRQTCVDLSGLKSAESWWNIQFCSSKSLSITLYRNYFTFQRINLCN